MKRLTGLWVRKAEDDLVGARSLERGKPSLNDLVCFHCQQSAEKYLKALLQEYGSIPPRTHNLVDLLTLLLVSDPSLSILRRALNSLSRYAVEFRYPGRRSTRRKALAALGHAETVRREIRTRLRLRI
jgi:HEPN domain-containing protein